MVRPEFDAISGSRPTVPITGTPSYQSSCQAEGRYTRALRGDPTYKPKFT